MAEKVSLYIYRDDSDGNTTLFPDANEPAIITEYEYEATRMGGAPKITADLMYPSCLDEEWRNKSYGKPYVTFNGETFYVAQVPSSSKSNTDTRYKHEVELVAGRIVIENVYAYDVVSTLTEFTERTDVYRSNTTSFSFYGDINEFVARINESLVYSKVASVKTTTDDDGNEVADLDDDGNIQLEGYYVVVDDGVETDSLEVSFEDLKVSEALQEIYNVYELTYYWVGKVCHVGTQENIVESALEYGHGAALMAVEKDNANTALVDIVTGYGGSTNLQYYYPNESSTGTAIFETTNIESTEVSSVELSAIIRYSADYLKTWIYCTRDASEVTEDVTAYMCPRAGLESATSISSPTITITTTTTAYESSGYYDSRINGTYVSEVMTLYAWNFSLRAYGSYLSQFSVKNLVVTRDGTTITPEWVSKISDISDDYAAYSGKVVIVGRCIDEDDLSESELSPDYAPVLLDGGYYTIKLTCYYVYPAYAPEDSEFPRGSSEDIDWVFALVSGLTFTSPTSDTQFFLYGATDGDTDEYETITYASSGIEFADASTAKSATVVAEISVNTETNDGATSYVLQFSDVAYGLDDAARVTITGRQWMTVCSKLMPSIYRETLGADRFYPAINYASEDEDGNTIVADDADDRYIIPDTEEYYTFENEYDKSDPHEAITEDSDIYPTIKNVVNANGDIIGEIADIAFDANDSDATTENSDEDNPTYIHSYFYIKLHIFDGDMGFNLFTHALYSESAYLTLTSGNCSAGTFEIAVVKEENDEGTGYIFYNPVITDGRGNLLQQTEFDEDDYGTDEDGNPKYLGDYILGINHKDQYTDEQQDTSANEVWIAVKKDNDTFGVIMPNALNDYKPSKGDTFVLTGIGLPQTYIDAAERKLDEYLVEYMWENNTETFNYKITFSRIWIEKNPTIAAQINENTLLNLKYNGIEHALFVSTYKCKADDKILYEIEVELTDELTLGSATLKTQVDGIEGSVTNILASIKALKSSSSSAATALSASLISSLKKLFLSKTDADSAAGLITLLKGLALGTGGYYITEEGVALLNSITAALGTISGNLSVGGALSVTGNTIVGSSVTSSNFSEAEQRGFVISKDADTGSYTLKIANMEIWGKATFNEVEIRKVSAIGGTLVVSGAASKIVIVDYFYYSDLLTYNGSDIGDEDDYIVGWKCYYAADDGTTATMNTWEVGDQARCQSFNIEEGTYEDVVNKDYWRAVVAVSEENSEVYDEDGNVLYDGQKFGWVALSLTNCQDGDATTLDEDDDDYDASLVVASSPSAGDSIVLLGHQAEVTDDGTIEYDATRMNAIIISAAGEEPYQRFYENIYTFSLDGRLVMQLAGSEVYIMADRLKYISGSGATLPTYYYAGTWVSGTSTAYTYWYFTYDGDLWLWTGSDSTTADPSESVDGWQRMTYNTAGRVLTIGQALGGLMYYDETETITLSVWSYDLGTEYTDEYTFSIERDSGDESSDAVWNALAAHTDCGTEFNLEFADMNFTSGSRTTKFTIHATNESEDISENIEY